MPYEKVVEVIDGDTFRTPTEIIRLADVQAPEKGTPYSAMAKDKLKDLILNKYIRYEIKARDPHGRAVSLVWVNSLNVNDEMKRYIKRIMP
jgi:endonuclease YncB( thermonuclease family)